MVELGTREVILQLNSRIRYLDSKVQQLRTDLTSLRLDVDTIRWKSVGQGSSKIPGRVKCGFDSTGNPTPAFLITWFVLWGALIASIIFLPVDAYP